MIYLVGTARVIGEAEMAIYTLFYCGTIHDIGEAEVGPTQELIDLNPAFATWCSQQKPPSHPSDLFFCTQTSTHKFTHLSKRQVLSDKNTHFWPYYSMKLLSVMVRSRSRML